MPNAIYNYVYYEPLQVGGPVTRQNRNPVTSPSYLPVPEIVVPSTNDLATASVFVPDVPQSTFTDSNGNVYNFGFMNVSGTLGAGQTSTDINNLPGSSEPLIVGNQVINILVMYIIHTAGGGSGGAPGIYMDAFDETTGSFLDNFFILGINPDVALVNNVNVYGSLPVQNYAEFVQANLTPINTTGVLNSLANFDKWVTLEGPAGNPVINGNDPTTTVEASTPSDIAVFAFYREPLSVYITGGYASPDILLFTPFSTTSLGTEVPFAGGTTVLPGIQYGFAAVVHNDSEYDVSTRVTFWNIPGGVGTAGSFLDTQTVIIPANSSVTAISSMPFINNGGHTCAAVSLNTEDTPCQFNPSSSADSVNIPNPAANVSHSCSAWRNTNTSAVHIGFPWHFDIALGDLHGYADAPIAVQFNTQHVAADFAHNDKVLEIVKANSRIYGKVPPYLIPELRKTLPAADLNQVVTLTSKGKISDRREGNGYLLHFTNKNETGFRVAGTVPKNAKVGDTFLVQVTAHYPKTGRLPERAVGFLQILVVQKG